MINKYDYVSQDLMPSDQMLYFQKTIDTLNKRISGLLVENQKLNNEIREIRIELVASQVLSGYTKALKSMGCDHQGAKSYVLKSEYEERSSLKPEPEND
jgi:hypothetical protein